MSSDGQVSIGHIGFSFDSRDDAQKFAENLFYILKDTKNYKPELVESKIIANAYKELGEKPTITEEQRRYIVQANALNNEKKYPEALEYYEKAIQVNSTAYPSAYYNMALIAAQVGRFKYAILI